MVPRSPTAKVNSLWEASTTRVHPRVDASPSFFLWMWVSPVNPRLPNLPV